MSYNLPPGCTNSDIERAAGAFDEPEKDYDYCAFDKDCDGYTFSCCEESAAVCDECDTPFCSDHGSKGGDVEGGTNVDRLCHGAYAVPSVCWKCGGYNADE